MHNTSRGFLNILERCLRLILVLRPFVPLGSITDLLFINAQVAKYIY